MYKNAQYLDKVLLLIDFDQFLKEIILFVFRECYLRFSSQLFSLEDLHESIHLTNNAIQKNYTNNLNRNTRLPAENMWHNTTFQEYLK